MRARSICTKCPVRAECLDFAANEEKEGGVVDAIYGGLSPQERRRIRRRKLGLQLEGAAADVGA